MRKPKMLYASPFWPMKSGISNYSSALLQVLQKYYDITLLVDDYEVEDITLNVFPKIKHKPGALYKNFDVILYNIGNQPDYHGYMLDALQHNFGYIILHDLSLYYLIIGEAQKNDTVFSAIYREAGVAGIQLVKDSLKQNESRNLLEHKHLASELLLNRVVLENAKGIFVHSEYARQAIQQMKINRPVWHINLVMSLAGQINDEDDVKKIINNKWHIPPNAFLLAAAGFIAPSKQNKLTCQAVEKYNATHAEKIYYLMIGEGNDADDYLGKYCQKTGFVDEELYEQAIRRADLIFNLRNPTNGETSGTLIQAMQLGKPCVTTAIGWFDELPDDTVKKVSPTVTDDELVELLERVKNDELKMLGQRAKAYMVKEYAPETIAKHIFDCLEGTKNFI